MENAPLSGDFMDGKTKLIPVIFSHGLIANRNYYQVMGQEFASNGYIVFIPDHLDGSTSYTLLKDGTKQMFDTSQVRPEEAFKI